MIRHKSGGAYGIIFFLILLNLIHTIHYKGDGMKLVLRIFSGQELFPHRLSDIWYRCFKCWKEGRQWHWIMIG